MRYAINPELDAQLKEEWDRIGLSKETQENLFDLMHIAAIAILNKETRRIAHCLVDEGLPPEKIKSITGCTIETMLYY